MNERGILIEQRSSPRYGYAVTVFLEKTPQRDRFSPDIVICNSVDLSSGGLQVVLDDEIAIGKILRLCLDIRNKPPLFVVGEAVWKRRDAATGNYHVGFRLLESEDTDYESWPEAIAELLAMDNDIDRSARACRQARHAIATHYCDT